LVEAVDSFDILAMKSLLSDFADYVEKLEKIVAKKV
jgi:hypothetical protein